MFVTEIVWGVRTLGRVSGYNAYFQVSAPKEPLLQVSSRSVLMVALTRQDGHPGPHFAFVSLWNKLALDEYNPLTVLSSKEELQKNRAYLWIQTQEAVLF